MNAESGKRIMVRGAFWTVAMRFGVRILGLVNTVIMARILMPSEYGIVAMASVVVGIIQSLLDFGAGTALLRKNSLDKDYIDSAWTLRVLEGALLALLLIILSPVASLYFGESKVMVALCAFGFSMMVGGVANIGLILAQKSYNFEVEFKVYISAAVVRVLVTILAGLTLRDYRALILGIVIGELASTVLSYVMHSYRPRWNTRNIREIWALTKWLMLSSTGRYILRRGDELIAGRIAGSAGIFGVYSVGSDLGQMPTSEVGQAMQRAVLPLLSSMSDSYKDVNSSVIKVVNAVNTVTWPLGLGLAALAGPFTLLILGQNWTETQFYMAGFALVGVLQSLPSAINTLLVLRGHTKQHSMTVWFELCAFLLASIVLVPMFSLMGLVGARAIGAVVGFGRTTMFARNLCQLNVTALFHGLWRPVIGALLMFFLVHWVSARFDGMVEQLIAGVSVGATFYIAWCLLTWVVSGRPDGLELMVLRWLKLAILRRGPR